MKSDKIRKAIDRIFTAYPDTVNDGAIISQEVNQLEQSNAALLEALKAVEWVDLYPASSDERYEMCPACEHTKKKGHWDECYHGNAIALAKAQAEGGAG